MKSKIALPLATACILPAQAPQARVNLTTSGAARARDRLASTTWTKAEITSDALNPATVGNAPKMPGYGVTNAFVQYRPADSVTVMLNANNLFDVLGLVEVDADRIPSSGVVTAHNASRLHAEAI